MIHGDDDVLDALEASGIGLWSWRVGDDAIRWNRQMGRLFGRTDAPPPRTYEAYLGLIHPEDRDEVDRIVSEGLAHAADHRAPGSYRVEHRVQLEDGTVRWIEGRGSLRVDDAGRPIHMSGTAVDCTQRKLAEQALRASEETFRLYAELASDYVYVAEVGGAPVAPSIVAGSFERTTGYTPQDVVDRGGWARIIHADDQASVGEVLQSLAAGRPAVLEYRIIGKDGEVRWLRDRARPVLDPHTQDLVRIQGAVQDITEHMRLEHQLLEAQKHEALARFSGGVAHDFNNLLGVVLGSVELIDLSGSRQETLELLDAVRAAAESAASLTRGLLLFGRRSAGTPRVVEWGDQLRQMQAILKQGLGPGHELVLEVPGEPMYVRIDPSQAQLVLLNLVVNASHAMERSGRVTITAWEQQLDSGDPARPAALSPGTYVTTAVTDQGSGIPAQVMPRLFEPFFTTRGPGRGTGLGLATCQGVLAQVGGTIHAKNRSEGGATFTILLPAQSAPESADVAPSSMRISSGGTESLLVVEDEPMLRRILRRALTARGYRVEVVSGAEQALKVLEQQTFDLMISDIVMPGMDGVSLADHVSERWPQLRILLVSGNSDGATFDYAFLAKPWTAEQLSRKVREVLLGDPLGT